MAPSSAPTFVAVRSSMCPASKSCFQLRRRGSIRRIAKELVAVSVHSTSGTASWPIRSAIAHSAATSVDERAGSDSHSAATRNFSSACLTT
ncbi:hypothetical protein D3C73_887340 [compost metagenome]